MAKFKPRGATEWERAYIEETMMMRTRFFQSWFSKHRGDLELPWHCKTKVGSCKHCRPLFTDEVEAYIAKALVFK